VFGYLGCSRTPTCVHIVLVTDEDNVRSRAKIALTGNEGLSEKHHGFEGLLVVKETLELQCETRRRIGERNTRINLSCE